MRRVKKIISLLLVLAFAAVLFSCGKNSSASGGGQSNKIDEINLEKNIKGKKIAVVYFSVNDQAEMVAEEIATEFNGDLHKIEPQVPYTEEDLDLNNPNSRINIEDDISLWGEEETTEETIEIAYGAIPPETEATTEGRNLPKELPKIKPIKVNDAKIVIVGFPSWKKNAPKPVYTFLKTLKDKIIVPFCTDGEFGIIDEYINNFVDKSNKVMTGKELSEDTTIEEIRQWMAMLSADFEK